MSQVKYYSKELGDGGWAGDGSGRMQECPLLVDPLLVIRDIARSWSVWLCEFCLPLQLQDVGHHSSGCRETVGCTCAPFQ
jgi:hypothetical protein